MPLMEWIKKCLFLLCFCSIVHARVHPESGVTYTLSGGRFGDNLLSVAHALWLAHSLDLPLVYTPFPYGDQLALSKQAMIKNFTESCVLSSAQSYTKFWNMRLSKDTGQPTLVTLPYAPEFAYEYDSAFPIYTQINWDDPVFVEKLRAYIRPSADFPNLALPQDRTTVALHIRTGAGFDVKKFQALWPLKGPPLSYYIDGLKILAEMHKTPLYIHIFTDHQNPSLLKKDLEKAFIGKDLVFVCRTEENRQDKNVLEDFFAMGAFDCLIRTDSHYSLMAAKLFPYQVVISPLHAKKLSKKEHHIDKVLVEVKEKKGLLRTVISTP